jgi:hypothetical protein
VEPDDPIDTAVARGTAGVCAVDTAVTIAGGREEPYEPSDERDPRDPLLRRCRCRGWCRGPRPVCEG